MSGFFLLLGGGPGGWSSSGLSMVKYFGQKRKQPNFRVLL
jgi:hypothetical protein